MRIYENKKIQLEKGIRDLSYIAHITISKKGIIFYDRFHEITIFDHKIIKIKEIKIRYCHYDKIVSKWNNIFVINEDTNSIMVLNMEGEFIREIDYDIFISDHGYRFGKGFNIIGDKLFVIEKCKVKIFKLKY